MECIARVGSSKACKESIGAPAEAVCEDHHNHHACHLLLSLLGRLRFFLLLCYLEKTRMVNGGVSYGSVCEGTIAIA